ncbi:DUF3102 domain-containing protein [Clostridium lacusfryxellense]|uniref:DUF3102 domain-containing protein n=1 Tax=Clostridium lacusfryxellense TaxID=205328 RepID=UPI001C0B1B02|nr:DUF3102 domain-containing protein [Clostridium lacusfryxellense]MBU3111972.1 DUF3102 domain-containing protein [Clostridium lacusfryxellense]
MNEIQNIDTLTTEILILKQQTAQSMIEIGKRLIIVKESLPHGEWGKWLEEKVDFKQTTASKFMRVAKEFSNFHTYEDLTQSKIFALLDLPQEQRETFVKDNPVDEMTTRELQKAIKENQDLEEKLKESREFNKKASELVNLREDERNKAIKASEAAKRIAIEKSEDVKNLQDELRNQKDKAIKDIEELQTFIGEAKSSGNDEEVVKLNLQLLEIQGDLDSSAHKIDELEVQLKERPIDVITAEPIIIEKVPEDIQKELEELRSKTGQNTTQPVIKFKIYFDELQNIFRNELEVMEEIKKDYPEMYLKCKNGISNLINKMAERL